MSDQRQPVVWSLVQFGSLFESSQVFFRFLEDLQQILIIVRYFRESPRGSQNLVPHALGTLCAGLLVTTVIQFRNFRGCVPNVANRLVRVWSSVAPCLVPDRCFLFLVRAPVWSQFRSSLMASRPPPPSQSTQLQQVSTTQHSYAPPPCPVVE